MTKRQIFVASAFSIGLTMAIATNALAAKCTLVQIEEWPVRLVRNHLIVDGAINGTSVGIVLDTGATRSFVLYSAALRLNLPRQQTRSRVFGIGGESKVEVANIEEFRIGQAARKDWKLLIAGEHDFGEGVDFVLGEDFFRAVDIEFDLQHGMVRLFQPMDCKDASLAYWTAESAGVVEFERVGESLPEIMLTVHINGKPVHALLDSGASASVVTSRDAAMAGVTPETPGVVTVGKSGGVGKNVVDSWIGPFESVAIGNRVIKDTRIHFADIFKSATVKDGGLISRNVMPDRPMLLGADFLQAHRVFVAHSQRKIYFTHLGGPVFDKDDRVDATGTK